MQCAETRSALPVGDVLRDSLNKSLSDSRQPSRAMVIAPSLGWRFSGINATMEALVPVMARAIPIACCGRNLSSRMPVVGLLKWLVSPQRHRWRIWHARRNSDMLAGLLLRYVFRRKLILVWTSAAQRHHRWLTRFYYQRMDAVLATTKLAAEYLKCPAEVSHHGVNVREYFPAPDKSLCRQQLDIEDRPTLGVFGRVRPQKGSGDLVEALVNVLGDYPAWQVKFVGQVTPEYVAYRDRLKAQLVAAGLEDRVHFTGFLKDFSELPKWYQAMDAVACVSRNEGFGVTCLEAMACGVPVLATRAGAWPDIIEPGEDGWLVGAADVPDLANGLEQLCKSTSEELAAMGKRARAKVCANFAIEHESERLIALYDRLFDQFSEADWRDGV